MLERVRAVLALCAGLALSACNMVVTERPLVTAADAVEPPPLREGVWIDAAVDCRVDEKKPIKAWPSCAGLSVVRGAIMSQYDAKARTWTHALWRDGKAWSYDAEAQSWSEEQAYLLSSGDPQILQIETVDEEQGRKLYYYWGVRARLDEAGRAVEMSTWPVDCGPPTKDGEPDVLFPGVVPDETLRCTSRSLEDLRAAAAASEAQQKGMRPWRWVREGDR